MRSLVPLVLLLATTSWLVGPSVPRAGGEEAPAPVAERPSSLTFESHVRSLLKAQCFHCHGDEEAKEANLDLRLVRWMHRGGDSGPALVAGKPEESLLYQRVAAGEMPPGERKLSSQELELLRKWIEQGAATARPEPESLADDGFTPEERSFWSFQPIRLPQLPRVVAAEQLSSAIDTFLLTRLETQSLAFSPEADRATLLRRVTIDLRGLPPTPEELDQFMGDGEPDAWERLLDRLLATPAYGERWARHWLDVAGYADSDGYNEQDAERKYAYKYRDYVIRAFLNDRPWSELIQEQLAGDELLTPPFTNLSPDQAERLVATGFLRMGPDGTANAGADTKAAANDCLTETIKIVSSSLLGLSVGCAQCHNHRYDPIPQQDYYRMRALFEPAYDWTNWRRPANRLISLWTDAQRQQAAECDAEIKRLEQERLSKYEALIDELREKEIASLPAEVQEQIRVAAKTPAAKRTDEQKKLLADHPKANIPVGLLDRNAPKEHKAITAEYAQRIDEVKARRPGDDFALALSEVPGRIPPTYVFYRGEINQPREEVAPGELAILGSVDATTATIPKDDEALPTSGRRLAYARHLTSGQHPLVPRVLMNRVWLHHFGRGIVGTPADFGQLGEPPTHPELLDWLAHEFVQGGWTLKRMHRQMLTSTAYRQSSVRRPDHDAVDPENHWLGRMNVRRLDAELVRDALLRTSGQLVEKLYGPPVPVTPDETGIVVVGVDTRDSAGRPTGKKVPLFGEEFRRSVYVQVRRSMALSMLETFDGATLAPNCVARTPSTVATQSLLLMNNEFVVEQSAELARRLRREAGSEPREQVRLGWRLAFGREPTGAQVDDALSFLAAQAVLIEQAAAPDPKAKIVPHERALEHYCHALLSSNRFLYIE